ncbi:ABC transporter substrate-binding protein [Subtercola vilae]|uniref:Sugar ABC transporter substrate-binding protein n=1 Tax=Subtercola vilae TaxID=2056433 RepID=A0A4T2C5R2_9MICO|nr:sugar ABC transporter substrate-binding protein [Subtercola vilae]TIH39069.1 sugar ABC transporter substrate-binding protein [Subtercola vilae]
MKITRTRSLPVGRVAALATVGILLAGALAACSGSTPTASSSANADQIAAALQQKSTITYWSWTPQAKDQVAAFEAQYPNVTVNLVNAGTGNDEYTKLQNAIKAGSGAPDVAQIEYYAMPQFELSKSLTDLSSYGFSSLQSSYSPSTWTAVTGGSAIYALPQDSGPMALFYNKAIFDQYGLTVPTTWDEYIADAAKLHAADPTKYITNDAGDAGLTTSLIWQAGGKPYVSSGNSVTVNLQDAGSKKYADMWNQLVEPGLVSSTPSWSDAWWKSLSDGSIASLVTGAWMPGNLETGALGSAGNWRVAPLPTYDGTAATAQNGGGGQAVLAQSKNQLVAAGFLQWLNSGPGVSVFLKGGGFPSTTAQLNDPTFLADAPTYFGGQLINKVLLDASNSVVPGWQYLPFQTYANSVFSDTVGQSYANKSDLNKGLAAWQESSVSYGAQQGFAVNK